MQTRFRLLRRGCRGGRFYAVDRRTGGRCSLQTDDPEEARRMLDAKNDAERQSCPHGRGHRLDRANHLL